MRFKDSVNFLIEIIFLWWGWDSVCLYLLKIFTVSMIMRWSSQGAWSSYLPASRQMVSHTWHQCSFNNALSSSASRYGCAVFAADQQILAYAALSEVLIADCYWYFLSGHLTTLGSDRIALVVVHWKNALVACKEHGCLFYVPLLFRCKWLQECDYGIKQLIVKSGQWNKKLKIKDDSITT